MFIKCHICEEDTPKAMTHEHHVKPRAYGGEDSFQNLITICNRCHMNIHAIASMMANPKRSPQIMDSLVVIYGNNKNVIKKCIDLAKEVYQEALKHTENKDPKFEEPMPIFTLPLRLKSAIQVLAKEKSINGKKLSMSSYVKLIVLEHIRNKFPQLALEVEKYKQEIKF